MVKPTEVVFTDTETQPNDGMVIDFDLLYVDTHSEWNPDNLLLQNLGIQNKLRGYKNLKEYFGKLYDWFGQYRQQLDFWKDKIESFRREVSNIYRRTRQNTIYRRITELIEQHKQYFKAVARIFALQHDLSDNTARRRVAGFVYIVTYHQAMQLKASFQFNDVKNNQKLVFALSYCWHVCGCYLHKNKRKCRASGGNG
eukprot:scaffold1559_cov176-Ochromonas_danica.AAC.1